MLPAAMVVLAILAPVTVPSAICVAVIVPDTMLPAATVVLAILPPVMVPSAICVAVMVPETMLPAAIVVLAILPPVIVEFAIFPASMVPSISFAFDIDPSAIVALPPNCVKTSPCVPTVSASVLLVQTNAVSTSVLPSCTNTATFAACAPVSKSPARLAAPLDTAT